jgi:hypothetical protein
MSRAFGHYEAVVRAGPKFPEVVLEVEYFDNLGQEVGSYGEAMIGFACTWKDVAEAIRVGLRKLELDADPVRNISPMVDLS